MVFSLPYTVALMMNFFESSQINGRCPLNMSVRVLDISVVVHKTFKETFVMTQVNKEISANCQARQERNILHVNYRIDCVVCSTDLMQFIYKRFMVQLLTI